MICNRRPTGWELVYQNAHGAVAMDLLARWREAARPARWTDLLLATAQHDNGWQEWEPGDHLTPLGTPRPFEETTMADVVRQSERALRHVQHASLWAALLVAEHFRTLYAGLDDPGVRAMLRAQTAWRAKWRRALGATQAEVAAAYPFLKWADTLSLLLCTRGLPFGERRVEVEPVGGVRYWAWARADGTVGVDPWPYDVEAFDVGAESYLLRRLTYPSAAALASALGRARIARCTWTLRREG